MKSRWLSRIATFLLSAGNPPRRPAVASNQGYVNAATKKTRLTVLFADFMHNGGLNWRKDPIVEIGYTVTISAGCWKRVARGMAAQYNRPNRGSESTAQCKTLIHTGGHDTG